jgi:hypothetical protein
MPITLVLPPAQGLFPVGTNTAIFDVPVPETTNPVDSAAETLAEHAAAIRASAKRVFSEIVDIGRRLTDVHKQLRKDREWLAWLETEFDWSDQTARRFMHVYDLSRDTRLNTCVGLGELPLGILYRLAAPKAEPARQEIANRAAAGEEVTRETIETAIAHHKKTETAVAEHNAGDTARQHADDAGDVTDPSETDAASGAGEPQEEEAPQEEEEEKENWGETLRNVWNLAPEVHAEIIQGESIDRLLALMSDAQRAALFDRLIGQQIAHASPVTTMANGKKLLTNLTGTLHWGLGQADPANGAQALTIIAGKLKANKCDAKDVVFAWAKPRRK